MSIRSNLRAITTTAEARERASDTRPEPSALVGECVRIDHPTLCGRALVRWTSAAQVPQEAWLPTLLNVALRPSDRVLMLMPANFAEPVIVGVLDGFTPRPSTPVQAGAVLELQVDEVIRVQARDGTPLLELSALDSGPLVKLLNEDLSLELPGALRVSAASIALSTTQGEITIAASDDVVVSGTAVQLN